jgi:hypothetical protein
MRSIVMAIALAGAACGQPMSVGDDQIEDAHVSIKFKVLPEVTFHLPQMEQAARNFLETTGSTHGISALIAYNSPDLAAREAASCEGGYGHWTLLHGLFPQRRLASAQVLSFGLDAALQLRTPEGEVEHIVLRGTDPTRFSFEGAQFEILHVTGRVRSMFEGCSAGTVEPILYLVTEAPLSRELCKRVTNWLAARLKARYVEVSLANRPWFPCDGRFPLVYPFRTAEPWPSEDDYYSLSEFTCTTSCGGLPNCDEWVPREQGGLRRRI